KIVATSAAPQKLEQKIPNLLKKLSAKKTQSYPQFSSKAFRGNYLSARTGITEDYDIPERQIKIFNLSHIHTRLITQEEIWLTISQKIAKVKGDFRQEEILDLWQAELGKVASGSTYLVSKFSADVSSGTYIRS